MLLQIDFFFFFLNKKGLKTISLLKAQPLLLQANTELIKLKNDSTNFNPKAPQKYVTQMTPTKLLMPEI